ncbi:MAG: hypothetical protein IPP33_02350 [Flavobacteriales bacterium]|nr:hypothetical protein [Flavobacteriales bacterium]
MARSSRVIVLMLPPQLRTLLILVALSSAGSAFGQGSVSSPDTTVRPDWRARHQPKRATIYSALLPGAGQIYNRKYWKAPIAWGGLATCAYFIQRNNKEYSRYRDAYVALVDNDPNTTDEFNGQFSADRVREVADTYRKWRDLSWLCTAGVYILNVVDASVDAHFVRFDVGDDLSLNLGPSLPMVSQGAVGLSLNLALQPASDRRRFVKGL